MVGSLAKFFSLTVRTRSFNMLLFLFSTAHDINFVLERGWEQNSKKYQESHSLPYFIYTILYTLTLPDNLQAPAETSWANKVQRKQILGALIKGHSRLSKKKKSARIFKL